MELYAKGRPTAVTDCHDLVSAASGDLKAGRETSWVYDEGVVASDLEGLGEALEQAQPIVFSLAGFAVNRKLGPHDAGAFRCTDGLMAETDA